MLEVVLTAARSCRSRAVPTTPWEALTLSDRIQWVGPDVRASQITVAVLTEDTGELHRARYCGADVLGFLNGLTGA